MFESHACPAPPAVLVRSPGQRLPYGLAMMNWPSIIRRIRKTRRLSQEAFAALLGTTQTTVSRWETGIQTPDIIYRDLLMNFVRQDDPISSDCLYLSKFRSSLFAKSMLNDQMIFMEFSAGMRASLGEYCSRIDKTNIIDIIPEHFRDDIHAYFRKMLLPSSEICSIRHLCRGFILRDRIFYKTFSVIKRDGIRFIVCEDFPADDADGDFEKITVETLDEVFY